MWRNDLCEYFKVTPEEALSLGTRSKGRKPSLPGTETTNAVSGMTFEDIWDAKPRNTTQEIFDFYSDQGAWSAFRQVVRHKDMVQYHISIINNVVVNGGTYCEYGCGVAPFTFSMLQHVEKEVSLKIYLSDVDCEHFKFGVWRAQKIIKERGLDGITLFPKVISADALPEFGCPLDAVIIFEVLEHVPSPIETTFLTDD